MEEELEYMRDHPIAELLRKAVFAKRIMPMWENL
jgi:hypothetical protein